MQTNDLYKALEEKGSLLGPSLSDKEDYNEHLDYLEEDSLDYEDLKSYPVTGEIILIGEDLDEEAEVIEVDIDKDVITIIDSEGTIKYLSSLDWDFVD
jgi:hypothetical protein